MMPTAHRPPAGTTRWFSGPRMLAAALAVLLALSLLGGLGCATAGGQTELAAPPPTAPARPAWQAPLGHDHPLAGRIWALAEARFISRDELVTRLSATRFVLLGEKHDNPDHHRLQGELVAALGSGAQHRAVAFEMLDERDEPILGAGPGPNGAYRSAQSLSLAVGWATSGWPDFVIYAPLFEATLASGARVIAASPGRERVRTAMRRGFQLWPPELKVTLGLDKPLSKVQLAGLYGEIQAAHCGHAPAPLAVAMIHAQRLKDAWMARALREAAGDRGAILIAGRGHVRRDRGVPSYLGKSAGAAGIVAFIEVRTGMAEAASYPHGGLDYLYFTARMDDDDPCERFKERLRVLKRAPGTHP